MTAHEYVKKQAGSQKPDASLCSEQCATAGMRIRVVAATAPWQWLKQAAWDIRACHYQSLVYGLFFTLMGLGIHRAHEGNPAFAMGLSAAFMFAGPFLSIGLYELSRQLQAGERVDLVLSLFSWCRNPKAVGRFAFYLSVIMVFWLWLSSVLLDALGQTVSLLFVITLLIWAATAMAVFMASAVAIPMMLDRPVTALQAVRFSLHSFRINTRALGVWAFIVASVVGVSLLLGYWPLLLAGPLLGHGSWHAYRAIMGQGQETETR